MRKNIAMQKYRLRLTTTIPVLAVLILAVAFGVLGYTSARIGEENIHTAVRAFGHPMTTVAANSLFNPLHSQNAVQMRRILVQYVEGDAIVFAAIYNRDGEKVVQVSDTWRPEQSVSAELALSAITQNIQVEQEIEEYLVLSSPIAAGNQVIGAVEFAFDQNIIRASYLETQQRLFVFMLVTLLAIALFFFFLIRVAVMPLSNLVAAAQKIGEGNLDTHVPVKGAYEVALLAESLESMRADLLKGYNELQDVMSGLEQHVAERTRAAEFARADAEAQAWSTRGHAQLSEQMRGDLDLPTLANNITSHLSRYIGAQTGALFVASGNVLKLTGRYAYVERAGQQSEFRLGESLVGEAAKSKRIILVDDIPADAPLVSSALGESIPRQILIAPLESNGQVLGVIEFATLTQFTPEHQDFLKRVSESVAIALRTASTRLQMSDLLMRSQQQAEELQAQEEELRASNEELQAQAEQMTRNSEGKR